MDDGKRELGFQLKSILRGKLSQSTLQMHGGNYQNHLSNQFIYVYSVRLCYCVGHMLLSPVTIAKQLEEIAMKTYVGIPALISYRWHFENNFLVKLILRHEAYYTG